jgi:uncharacterized protein
MDITPLIPGGRQVIDSYGSGRFQVSQEYYTSSILVTPDWTKPWSVQNFDDISINSLAPILAEEAEILIIGAGERMQLMALLLRQEFREAKIAVDIMDTGAACRTYNLLMGDGRRVAAALLALP